MCKRGKTRDRILVFINQYTGEHGFSPTLREIADGVGLSSPGSVHHHIAQLKEEGLLKDYAPRHSRSLVISNSIAGSDTGERHICLKTDNGETLFLNLSDNHGEIHFEGTYYLKGEYSSWGQIIACSELGEEEYYASIV